ncbi:MAG: four helix bundle protein [Oscillospiraceae bacterium]|nr:four helix bundle protein [Oscillospiraceae bacterium]
MANKNELSETAVEMAVSVVNYAKWLMYEKKEFIMSRQLLRSGTSIGANIHEAYYAASRADFISKLQIALKEAAETEYWLVVLHRTDYFDSQFQTVKAYCCSLKRMLIAAINTAKEHQAAEQQKKKKAKSE